jgi:hypothetical protein
MKKNENPDPKASLNTVNNGTESENRNQVSSKSILSYMILSILPFIISLSLWYLVVELFELWKLQFYLFLLSYGIIILIFSPLISFTVAGIMKWLGEIGTKSKRKKPATRGQRLFGIVTSGFIIPILLSVLAYLVPVQGEDTVATLLIRRMKAQPEYSFVEKIGETVILSNSIDTKVAGIEALGIIQTDVALDQLIKILDSEGCNFEDWTALEYRLFSDAMTEAFASYESEVIDPLLKIFYKCDEQRKGIPARETDDLHTAYFEKPFAEIVNQIKASRTISSSEKEEVLDRLNKIEIQLKLDLLELEKETSLSGDRGDTGTTLDLILGSFNQMEKIEQATVLYNLSRRIAVDSSYSDSIRSEAIALTAKLGSQNDFAILLPYLNEGNERIKEATLKAIGVLYNKVEEKQEKDNK